MMRHLALSIAAALSLAAGGPALASHNSGGGGHGGSGAHGGGESHRSAAPLKASGGPSHGGGVLGALQFLTQSRRHDPPRSRGGSDGPPPFHGGRLLAYSDGNPYYCSHGHPVHWDRDVTRWTQWGGYTC